MTKYKLNGKYNNFSEFLLNIKEYFNTNEQTIHKARNELKIINYENMDTVVKSFKVPNLLRRVYYTYFRDTKAKKSYEYSLKIKEFTPTPIGYIEFYENNLLNESYFVSEKFEYDFTIREPLVESTFENRDEVFKAFARFTFELHENEILHKDYSPGNILIKKDGDNFLLKVVDINRMEFRPLSLDERLLNFSKLWAKDEYLEVMIKEYAILMNEDVNVCISKAIEYNQKHKNKINMKKKLKGIEVVD
jgi:serine/threonine protein kinase